MLDLEPAIREMASLVTETRDDQLSGPTPCVGVTLGDLIDHVDGLALAFTLAATKTTPVGGSQPPSPDASRLGPDWRIRIPERLGALAQVWKDVESWTGMTVVGGVQLPGDVAGVVALDELVVHGWDMAVSSGQAFTCDPDLLQATYEFVQSSVAQNPEGSPGLFGPPVPVPDDAPLLDRLIGLTGRDPAWRPASR
ncbi:TIGR03086 family protein [Phytoactinopolyspora alkaliphila]|uniref:TIGR03086 family protein n=1 Tax=Phytoactinopolyspora alkaliphila TaxID=1783498 RepID=A0A6N9YNV6_9ACTN|nr:TIGR03086 family metal-binding protein [Phytoactinopolyspora alkaliphila]NED96664.1 TIGR03086 family protein [Phytoactinopolyspora alkaliphila]